MRHTLIALLLLISLPAQARVIIVCIGQSNAQMPLCETVRSGIENRSGQDVRLIHRVKGGSEISQWLPGSRERLGFKVFRTLGNRVSPGDKVLYVWMQGEADRPNWRSYRSRERQLINYFRNTYGGDWITIGIGVWSRRTFHINRQKILNADRMNRVYYVSSDGAKLTNGRLHFSNNGLKWIGSRIVKLWFELYP